MKTIFLLVAACMIAGCSVTPITGRMQFDLTNDKKVLSKSASRYQDLLMYATLSADSARASMVKEVGKNIQQAVEQYMKKNRMSRQLKGYEWEFNLFKDTQPVAFCLPGGKIGVYEGFFNKCPTDTCLAVVLAYEVGVVLASHNGEIPGMLFLQGLGLILIGVFTWDMPVDQQLFLLDAYAAACAAMILNYDKNWDSENDKIGMAFMAMAGYDPKAAIAFREKQLPRGEPGLETNSTKLSPDRRIRKMQAFLPKAMKYYHPGN